jgi:hypothetical protein
MGILGKRAIFETIRSIDSATFTGSYQKLGSAITNPSVLMKLFNNSGSLITISFDGVNDHDVMPAGSFEIFDFGSDSQSVSGDARLALPAGTQVFVKASSSTGLVYLVTVYQGG